MLQINETDAMLLMELTLLNNTILRCSNIIEKLLDFSDMFTLQINNLIETNPGVFIPISESWTVENTLEFRQQIVHPITDNSIRERLILEDLLWMHKQTDDLLESVKRYGDLLIDARILTEDILSTRGDFFE